MAEISLREENDRTCDFCGSNCGERSGSTERDEDRDICKVCVAVFHKQFYDREYVCKPNYANPTMNVNSLAKRLLSPQTRKFIKAGYMNRDLSLTGEGQSELLAIILKKESDELEKSAVERIAEMKEDKE